MNIRKFLFIFAFISSLINMQVYAIDVQSLFNAPNNGDIIYYKSDYINSDEYIKAQYIKSNLENNGYKVYSIIIADILKKEGNEFIALISSLDGNKINIYNNDKEEFSYTVDKFGINATLDLENFYEKKNEVGIIKYYILNDDGKDRYINMYLFRIDDDNIKLISDMSFYKEINSMKSSVIAQMDNIFCDIDGDGIYEMLVKSREKISGGNERIEYQIYKLIKGRYECIMSSWLEGNSIDLSKYFNKNIIKYD